MAKPKREQPVRGWLAQQWIAYARTELYVGPDSPAQLASALRAEAQIHFGRGRLRAEVEMGQWGNLARAEIRIRPQSDKAWRRVLDAVAADVEVARRLLNGNPGPELAAAFAAGGHDLFPEPYSNPPACSCNHSWNCRHLNALVIQTAALLDANPFLWLEVLGMRREAVVAGVRARLADSGQGAESAAAAEGDAGARPLDPQRFWITGVDPDTIAVRAGRTVRPEGLLRSLGPLPAPEPAVVAMLVRARPQSPGSPEPGYQRASLPLGQVLEGMVRRIGTAAAALGRGDGHPVYLAEATPGAPVPTGSRLAGELAAALRQEDGLIGLPELRDRCPTAAAMSAGHGLSAVQDALSDLPEGYVAVARLYAGPRAAVLSGAAFAHVVSFSEWHDGRLSPDADWARAIGIAGFALPCPVRAGEGVTDTDALLRLLGAEVGDELLLTVADAGQPLLSARRIPRAQRQPGERRQATRTAVETLIAQMNRYGLNQLSEADALGVLLAEGHCRAGTPADEVWLLPPQEGALHATGTGRGLSRQPGYWRPDFGRWPSAYWSPQKHVMAFQAELIAHWESRRLIEGATAVINWWCQHCRSAQDDPARAAPLASLLEFLWLRVPLEAARQRIPAESIPAVLSRWFAHLAQGNQRLQQAYAPHIAACDRAELYHTRMASLPRPDQEQERREWEVEGYRWIGPGLYFQ